MFMSIHYKYLHFNYVNECLITIFSMVITLGIFQDKIQLSQKGPRMMTGVGTVNVSSFIFIFLKGSGINIKGAQKESNLEQSTTACALLYKFIYK